MGIALEEDDIDRILARVKALAQAEFNGAMAHGRNDMPNVDFNIRRAQVFYADIEILLGRTPGPPLEF